MVRLGSLCFNSDIKTMQPQILFSEQQNSEMPEHQLPHAPTCMPAGDKELLVENEGSAAPRSFKIQSSLTSLSKIVQIATEAAVCPSDDIPLALTEGHRLPIGNRRYRICTQIGEGAYAKVIGARVLKIPNAEETSGADAQPEIEGDEVAIKEMLCGEGPGILPDASVKRAVFEIQAMQRVAIASTGDHWHGMEVCTPRVLDYKFWKLQNTNGKAFLCRVVMTRRPGQPLASWFAARQSVVAATRSIVGTHASALAYCKRFCDAVFFARELISQLGPTLGRLNDTIAYHRDVNARNILIYLPIEDDSTDTASADRVCGCIGNPSEPPAFENLRFSLVDFGLSVDVRAWHCGGGKGSGSWQAENPTGDARYWGPASWIRFFHGPCGLADYMHAGTLHGSLEQSYTRRLDLFALAICALESIGTLHYGTFFVEADSSDMCNMFLVKLAMLVHKLHNTWVAYWNVAVSSFSQLGEYSRLACTGDMNGAKRVWDTLVEKKIPSMLLDKLFCIREALTCLTAHSRTAGTIDDIDEQLAAQVNEVADTCDVIHDMIDENSTLEWIEIVRRLCEQRNRFANISPFPVQATADVDPEVLDIPPLTSMLPIEMVPGTDLDVSLDKDLECGIRDDSHLKPVTVSSFFATDADPWVNCEDPSVEEHSLQTEEPGMDCEIASPRGDRPLKLGGPRELFGIARSNSAEENNLFSQVESNFWAVKRWYREAVDSMSSSGRKRALNEGIPASRLEYL